MLLPEEFVKYTKRIMDNETWQALYKGLCDEPLVSIHLNPLKCFFDIQKNNFCNDRVAWCKDGYYLKERPNFTFDPLLHAGLYYVQEASSMFLDLVLRQYTGNDAITMLDLCAAPGGKSIVAKSILPKGSLLISNEPIGTRAQILAENILKFGDKDVIVTNNYPKDFRKSGMMFDIILTDVPCSGEGMFRKDETAINEWSIQNVEKCKRLQQEIVFDAWQCLKPGGLLIYSTCTFNTKENEENIQFIKNTFNAEILPVNIESDWNITNSLLPDLNEHVYRFLPGKTRGEGLFMAVLRKIGCDNTTVCQPISKKSKKNIKDNSAKQGLSPDLKWLKSPDDFDIVKKGDSFIAIPKSWRNIYDIAERSFKVLSAGIKFGETKGKDIIPAQSLALSTSFNAASFPQMELDYKQAISYLRKEAIPINTNTPTGYVLMTYKGHPIGFGKNVGNRINNLYPTEWRIRSSHIPNDKREIFEIQ
ncbi:MAG: hypothetical protein LUD48_05975 [Prevotella sp.]|nr:hypothetical protein [Prevotella sp.]